MSFPIAPTPILRGKSAKEFDKKIAEESLKPTFPVDTPKIEEARRLAREYAKREEKSF